MQNTSDRHNLIATALIGVVKQIKAIRYYPPGHPAPQAAAAESLRSFAPVLAGGRNLALTVRKEGFLIDDQLVAKSSQVLAQLASFCFARRVQQLTFLSDLNSRDLHLFVNFLLLDPQVIHKQGGIQAILEKARLTTIWTNIRDLEDILQRRQAIESLPEEPNFDPATLLSKSDEPLLVSQAEAINLETLLAKLEQEQDDARFQRALQELIPLLRMQLSVDRRPLALRAFVLLCRSAGGRQSSAERRTSANQALDQLANDEITDYLLDFLFADDTGKKTSDTLAKIIVFLGGRISRRLMTRLASAPLAAQRKTLSDLLGRSGIAVLPVVYEYLGDERWYAVRNAVAILGDIRCHESLARLAPLLQHEEIRVRRETIRALTKIGGQSAIKMLVQVTLNDDHEMRRQAILSLGAMRATEAVPTLLKLLTQTDWSQRAIDLKKDTIRALAEIRSADALPELLRIVTKKRWLRRQLNDELRLTAATALGDIGDEGARKALEKITHDRNAAIARAALWALKQLDKANP